MTKPKFQKINDLYVDEKYQIFHSLYKLYSEVLPWRKHPVLKDLTSELLDTMYRYHSGLKTIHYPIASDIEKYDSADYAAYYIYSMASPSWNKDFEVLFSDINFLDNVDIKENIDNINENVTEKEIKNNEFYNSERKDSRISKDKNNSILNENGKVNTLSTDNYDEKKIASSTSEREGKVFSDDTIFTFNAPKKSIDNGTGVETYELPSNDSQNMTSSDNRDKSITDDILKSDRNTLNETDSVNTSNSETNSETNENDNREEQFTRQKEDSIKDNSINQNHNVSSNKGRDGRFTPQKMSAEQLEINKNLFFEKVFNYIDKIICIPCY